MTPTTWTLDPTHSAVSFSIRHMVVAKVRGRFGNVQTTVTVPGALPDALKQAKVEVSVDVASIDTGVADRDNHLRSADFFDVATFPKLTFVSRAVEPRTSNSFALRGDLTLHGVTREVVLDAEFLGALKDPWGNEKLAFAASGHLDRHDFGLNWNKALEAGGVLVGERVDITVEAQLVKAAASTDKAA